MNHSDFRYSFYVNTDASTGVCTRLFKPGHNQFPAVTVP